MTSTASRAFDFTIVSRVLKLARLLLFIILPLVFSFLSDLFQPFARIAHSLWSHARVVISCLTFIPLYYGLPYCFGAPISLPDAIFVWLVFLSIDMYLSTCTSVPFILSVIGQFCPGLYSATETVLPAFVISTVPNHSPSKSHYREYCRCRRAIRRRHRRLFESSCHALVMNSTIEAQLDVKLRRATKSKTGLFLVHDSGATRNLLCGNASPLLPYLSNRRPSPPGHVTVGGGRRLPYSEEGELAGITFTTVDALHYDLYSAIAAAKRGVRTVIDFDNGVNQSHLYKTH